MRLQATFDSSWGLFHLQVHCLHLEGYLLYRSWRSDWLAKASAFKFVDYGSVRLPIVSHFMWDREKLSLHRSVWNFGGHCLRYECAQVSFEQFWRSSTDIRYCWNMTLEILPHMYTSNYRQWRPLSEWKIKHYLSFCQSKARSSWAKKKKKKKKEKSSLRRLV